jgi:hypothetical protein
MTLSRLNRKRLGDRAVRLKRFFALQQMLRPRAFGARAQFIVGERVHNVKP